MSRTLTRASIVLSYFLFTNMVAACWVVIHGYNNDLIIFRVWRNNTGVSFLAMLLIFLKLLFNNSPETNTRETLDYPEYMRIMGSYIQIDVFPIFRFGGFRRKQIEELEFLFALTSLRFASVISQYPRCNLLGKRRGSQSALQPALPLPTPSKLQKKGG